MHLSIKASFPWKKNPKYPFPLAEIEKEPSSFSREGGGLVLGRELEASMVRYFKF